MDLQQIELIDRSKPLTHWFSEKQHEVIARHWITLTRIGKVKNKNHSDPTLFIEYLDVDEKVKSELVDRFGCFVKGPQNT